jgi:hypothetical protein
VNMDAVAEPRPARTPRAEMSTASTCSHSFL